MIGAALRQTDVAVDEVGQHDLVGALFRGELDAVIVRDVFPAAVMATVAAGLGALRPTPVRPGSPVALVGRPLQWVSRDLAPYFAERAVAERALETLFPPEWPFLARVHRILSSLAGLPIDVVTHPDGERYVPATIRQMPQGAEVGPHYELGQLDFPGYAALGTWIDRTTVLSYYVPVVLPETGGELVAYPLGPSDPDATRISDEAGWERGALSRYRPTLLLPREGDLLVFDSGRHVHRVSKIEGRTRWTIGGLIARSADLSSLMTWA